MTNIPDIFTWESPSQGFGPVFVWQVLGWDQGLTTHFTCILVKLHTTTTYIVLINGYVCFIFSVSGCTDHFEEDEESALETTRNIIATLNTEQSATPSGQLTVINQINYLASRNRFCYKRIWGVVISESASQWIGRSVGLLIGRPVGWLVGQSVISHQ